MRKVWLLAAMAMLAVGGCNQMSQDRYGVYADGDNSFVVNHDTHRINVPDGLTQVSAEDLLKGSEKGEGLSFTTWRDADSCGLQDSRGNVFLIPRKATRFDRKNMFFEIVPTDPVYAKVNGEGGAHEMTVKLYAGGLIRMAYTYDDAVGIRSIDRYLATGEFDRKILLQKGTGLLEHCRGFSLEDYGWYNSLNKK